MRTSGVGDAGKHLGMLERCQYYDNYNQSGVQLSEPPISLYLPCFVIKLELIVLPLCLDFIL